MTRCGMQINVVCVWKYEFDQSQRIVISGPLAQSQLTGRQRCYRRRSGVQDFWFVALASDDFQIITLQIIRVSSDRR